MTTLPIVEHSKLKPYHIEVQFGNAVSSVVQAKTLFALEVMLRGEGVPVEVFKTTMPDDLARRRDMTEEQRTNL